VVIYGVGVLLFGGEVGDFGDEAGIVGGGVWWNGNTDYYDCYDKGGLC